jgi:zinc protease
MANVRCSVGCITLATMTLAMPTTLEAQSAALRDTVLENGLQVIVLPSHTAPVATLEVVIRAGAYTQVEPLDAGVPHILEHMLFKTYGGNRGFGYHAAEAQASYNGTTSDERVTYFLTLPSEKVERGLELLGDMVRDPDFDRRDLDAERLVVRGELERFAADPYNVLHLISDMVLWGPAFQRKNALGNINTIQMADTNRLRDHYRKFYVPNNAALIVTGNVDVDEVFEWAHDRFRKWNRDDDPFEDFIAPSIEPLSRDTAFVVPVASTDVTFLIKWHGPSVADDPVGTRAADLFASITNQPTSGMQQRLVSTGVFQSVSLGYRTLNYVGPVTLIARTTPGMLGPAITALGAEIALMGDPDYFDGDDLLAAQRSSRVGGAIARESVASAAHGLADAWAVWGLEHYLTEEPVGVTDIRTFLDRYILDRPKVVALLGTAEIAEGLGSMINDIVAQWPTVR